MEYSLEDVELLAKLWHSNKCSTAATLQILTDIDSSRLTLKTEEGRTRVLVIMAHLEAYEIDKSTLPEHLSRPVELGRSKSLPISRMKEPE